MRGRGVAGGGLAGAKARCGRQTLGGAFLGGTWPVSPVRRISQQRLLVGLGRARNQRSALAARRCGEARGHVVAKERGRRPPVGALLCVHANVSSKVAAEV